MEFFRELKLLVFYLNEIEKGKKYLKLDKIEILVVVFGVLRVDLIFFEFSKSMVLVGELL